MYNDQAEEKKKQKGVKKGVNVADGSKRRQDKGISLREEMREQSLQVKRSRGKEGDENVRASSSSDPMAFNSKTDPEDVPVALLGVFVDMAKHPSDPALRLHGTLMVRKILSVESHPPIDKVIATDIVPTFVEYLNDDSNIDLQFEAAWALTNIASGTQQHTHFVMRANAAPAFVRILNSPKEEVREQATWALGNMAGDSAACRDYILSLGVMEPLLRCVSNPTNKSSVTRNAVWAVSNCCRSKPAPSIDLVSPALVPLGHLLLHTDQEVVTDALWAISYISDGAPERVQCVLNANIVPRIIQCLSMPATSMVTPAIRTIGNIVTGTDQQTWAVMNLGCLPAFHFLLSHPKRAIRKEVCWTISNITAGSPDQIQAVINANLIPMLLKCMGAAEFEVKKEAVWAVANATSGGNAEQIRSLVAAGCLTPLCDLLSIYDVKTVSVALEAIENILGVGDDEKKQGGLSSNPYSDVLIQTKGLDAIEALQTHSNTEIYTQVMSILEAYFELETANPITGAQGAQGSGFQFGAGAGGGNDGDDDPDAAAQGAPQPGYDF